MSVIANAFAAVAGFLTGTMVVIDLETTMLGLMDEFQLFKLEDRK